MQLFVHVYGFHVTQQGFMHIFFGIRFGFPWSTSRPSHPRPSAPVALAMLGAGMPLRPWGPLLLHPAGVSHAVAATEAALLAGGELRAMIAP